MINLLLILIFIIFPFGELTRLSVGSLEVSVSLLDLAVAGLVGVWVVGWAKRKKPKVFPPLTKSILFFIGAAIISLLVNSWRLSQRELIVSSLYLIRWVVYAGVYFVVWDFSSLRDPLKAGRGNLKLDCFASLAMTRLGLILAGVLAAIFGLLQYFLYPDLRNLSYLGWDPHKFRAFGTFLDPNFLGIILVLTIILLIGGRLEKLGRLGILGAYITLALTYSRSSYLAYLMGIGLISLIKKTPRLFLAAVLIGILTLLLLPKPSGSVGVDLGREDTIASRINNWKQSIVIAKDHPLFGSGFNAYRYAQRDGGFLKEENSHAGAGGDSSLLFVFATTGIIGTIAYLNLIYHILIYDIRKRNFIIAASLLAVVVHSFFNNTLFYPAVMLWMWIITGGDSSADASE